MSTRDITLRWDDPNMIEKGHKVYRSKSPMDVNNMPEPIATLDKNSNEFIDVNQTIGDTNYYRVSAWINGYEVFSEEVEINIEPYSAYIACENGVYKIDYMTGDIIWVKNVGELTKSISVYEKRIFIPVGSYNLNIYDEQGDLLTTIDTQQSISDIYVNNDSIGIVGGRDYKNYDKNNFQLRWDYSETVTLTATTTTKDNYVYIGTRNNTNRLTRFDNYGNYIEAHIGYDTTQKMSVDSAGDLYVTDRSGKLTKYDPQFNLIWSKQYSSVNGSGLSIDLDDNVYWCGYNSVYKHNSMGDVLWEYTTGGYFVDSALTTRGHILLILNTFSTSSFLLTLDVTDGTELYSVEFTDNRLYAIDTTPGEYKLNYDINIQQ